MPDEQIVPDPQDWFTRTWAVQDQVLWWMIAEHWGDDKLEPAQIVRNLRLWETPATLVRVLWFDHLYRLVIGQPGGIFEFGVRYGGDMILWDNLRVLYQSGRAASFRPIVGFDTFTGHPGDPAPEDGESEHVQAGAYGVGEAQLVYLEQLCDYRSRVHGTVPVGLVKGDVRETLPEVLRRRGWDMVALAYFDMDLYEATRAVLPLVAERMLPGGVIAFDEFGSSIYPGETIAARKALDLDGWEWHEFPLMEHWVWAVKR